MIRRMALAVSIVLALVLALVGSASAVKWANDKFTFSNVSATPATFLLNGGQYAVTVHATSWNAGSVTLQRQAVDGATMVTCLAAFSADGYATVNLPQGTYQMTIASATGVYADVTSVIANK